MKNNVYDIAKYRKRKRTTNMTKSLYKNKFTIAFFLLISLDIVLFVFGSLKMGLIFSLFTLFLILIAKEKKMETSQHPVPFKKPK